MKRNFCISLLTVAACVAACKSPEPSASTAASAEPAKSTSAGETPKPTDPASVKALTLDPSASKFDFVAAKITRSHNGQFKNFTGMATLVGDELQSVAAEVDTASIEADDPKLTEHLKSRTFSMWQSSPRRRSRAAASRRRPRAARPTRSLARLTLHGVTQEVTFFRPPSASRQHHHGLRRAAHRPPRNRRQVPGNADDLIKDEVVLKPTFVFAQK